MVKLKINTELIKDIIKKNNIKEEIIYKKFGKKNIREILENDNNLELTFNQATKLAKLLYISFGSLFSKKYESPIMPIADFRGNNDKENINIIRESINDSLLKQDWYREYLIKNDADKFPTVNGSSEIEVVNFINEKFSIKEILEEAKKVSKNPNDQQISTILKNITDELEKFNVIVIKNSVVSDNNNKKIELKDLRGYAIYDEYAPLIFINSKDTNKGKIFTLFHELAHIVLHSSGISSYEIGNKDIEKKCNNIAGNILMPDEEFKTKWNKWNKYNNNFEITINNINSDFILVSKLAIATKALLLNLIKPDEYVKYREKEIKNINKRITKQSGGNHYAIKINRNGKLFAKTLITETINGNELYRNAMRLLNIQSLKTMDNFIANITKNN